MAADCFGAGLLPASLLDHPGRTHQSMDSWAEQDWLGRFRALTEGRTGLMITHRFTTAMRADIIHVLDKGRVVESEPMRS